MKERKRRRTTQEVKDNIMQAVGNVLAKHGVNKLRVEVVASEAGMDKAMLYRHYKDFNHILRSFVEQEDFWINLLYHEYHIPDKTDLAPFVSEMIEKQLNELLNNSKLQELIIWELVDKSQLMQEVAQKREDMAAGILNELKAIFPHKNVSSNNLLAVIAAGIYYLALHKDISSFCTINLNNKEHRNDFISDLRWLIERTFSLSDDAKRIALNCIEKGMEANLIAEITELSVEHIELLKKHLT